MHVHPQQKRCTGHFKDHSLPLDSEIRIKNL